MNLRLHQITHWQDTTLPHVLDLYQTAFPPNEQMRLSWWVRLLNELSLRNGPAQPERFLYAALGDDPNDVAGFAYCEVNTENRLAYLMYLATRDDLRGQGVGALVYKQIVELVFTDKCIPLLVFEVEKPEVAALDSAEASEFARRRIRWYERQGAQRLAGIQYFQGVGWQPALEMDLMFHGVTPISPEEAFAAAMALFGDGIRHLDTLNWQPTL